jgi:hypothetical protein
VLFNEARIAYHAIVVDDAIRFVSQSSKERLKSSSSSTNGDEKEESKEPDYDEYAWRTKKMQFITGVTAVYRYNPAIYYYTSLCIP